MSRRRSTTCWMPPRHEDGGPRGPSPASTTLEMVREYATELLATVRRLGPPELTVISTGSSQRQRATACTGEEHRRRLARARRRGPRQLSRGAVACPSRRRRRGGSSVWPPRSATSGASAGTSRRAATASTKQSGCPGRRPARAAGAHPRRGRRDGLRRRATSSGRASLERGASALSRQLGEPREIARAHFELGACGAARGTTLPRRRAAATRRRSRGSVETSTTSIGIRDRCSATSRSSYEATR